ncbi:hypothetical protein BK796_20675 [Kosakonia pseudosacchari]|uniref:Uncharacterized protein n=1 Tax=Kosakonia pseudosacchari TaxID=1646340 RepID=A0ABX4IJJ1_9ENTR|nr:hypothetical protein [Kosakonia pseudosacchari]PDO83389.1 hypothetical protein BK796_20675 [Kosakonia pseudosacchari]
MESIEIYEVIKNLKHQARISKLISIALIYTLILVILLLFYNAYKMGDRNSPAGLLGDLISDTLFAEKEPQKDTSNQSDKKLAVTEYQKLIERSTNSAMEALKGSIITNTVAKAITSAVLTLTIVCMGIYTIKITLMFIRYYAQLSARYESQATAFMAANGDIDKTIKLIEALSANEIRMGATPESIYEKALDTVTKALAIKKD